MERGAIDPHAALPVSRVRPQPLIVLGASVRAASFSARRAGFEPWAADMFADDDLKSLCPARRIDPYPQKLIDTLAEAPHASWIYTGALENHPALIEQLCRLRPLCGNDAQAVRRVRDPLAVAEVLKKANLPVPVVTTSSQGLATDGRWLRKSRLSAGGCQVAPWRGTATENQSASEIYFQERIEGKACSAVYIAARGVARFIGATAQLLAGGAAPAHDFRYAGSIGPLPLSAAFTDDFQRLGNVLASAFDLQGIFGVDAVMADQTIWPVEINPRYTASIELLERAWNLPLVAWHMAACQQGALPSLVSNTSTWTRGKAILYAMNTVEITPLFRAYVDQANAGEEWPHFADLPAVGTRCLAHQPVLTVYVEGADGHSVEQQLAERLAETQRWLHAETGHYA